MKRFLIPLLCCLVAASSCKLEDTFYMANLDALVSVKDEVLVSDEGAIFNVTENLSDRDDYLTEGARYYMVYDILNRSFDIRIRNLMDVDVVDAQPQSLQPVGHDPVELVQLSVSGGYLNVGLTYYKAKGSDCEHNMVFEYFENTVSNVLEIRLLHDGADENPASAATSTLELDSRYYSVALKDLKGRSLTLTADVLATDDAGNPVIQARTVSMK